MAEVLARLDFEDDIYVFGLRGRLDPAVYPQVAERVIEARQALARQLVGHDITKLVETYDLDRYNSNATVAENVLFGTPIGPAFDFGSLAENTYVLSVLDRLDLTDDLVEAGRQVAEMMTEMFAGLSPEHEFFEQFSFIRASALPDFSALPAAPDTAGAGAPPPPRPNQLLSLPLPRVAARPRLRLVHHRLPQR